MKTAEFKTVGQVSQILDVPVKRLSYLIDTGKVPGSSHRCGMWRVFTDSDIQDIRQAIADNGWLVLPGRLHRKPPVEKRGGRGVKGASTENSPIIKQVFDLLKKYPNMFTFQSENVTSLEGHKYWVFTLGLYQYDAQGKNMQFVDKVQVESDTINAGILKWVKNVVKLHMRDMETNLWYATSQKKGAKQHAHV